MSKIISNKRASYNAILLLAVGSLSIITLLLAMNRRFDHDEFEHIHSAWYIINNHVPYRDFYQNHHPLFWYSIIPSLIVFGDSVDGVIGLRLLMYVLTIGIVFLTYLIARKTTTSKEVGLLSAVVLLSMVMFVQKSIEIRPDVPQVLFGLISIYCLLSFLQTDENKHMILAGLSASISFLFLQKTLFLLMAYALVFAFQLLRRRISIGSVFYFIVGFSPPLFLFFGYLVISGSLGDYILTNWILNIRYLQTFSAFRTLGRSLGQNGLFWLVSTVSVSFILLTKRRGTELKVSTLVGLVLLCSVFFVRAPHKQIFMFAIPLLCIADGYFLKYVFDRLRMGQIHRALLVALIIIQPLSFLLPRSVLSAQSRGQLRRIEHVVQNSEDSDLVYDGNIQFNLYRHDLHYFWYNVQEGKGLDTYNTLTDNKYGDYDICGLIKSRQPRFISDFELDIAECGLRALYENTPFRRLYIRPEAIEGIQHPLSRNLGEVVAFLAHDIHPATVQAGATLNLTLWWQALDQMDRDYTVFIHLADPQGHIWAQEDRLLQHGDYPTSTWLPGETVKDEYGLQLPPGTPPGEYTVKAGIYYWETGERLPVWDEHRLRAAEDAIVLDSVIVVE